VGRPCDRNEVQTPERIFLARAEGYKGIGIPKAIQDNDTSK